MGPDIVFPTWVIRILPPAFGIWLWWVGLPLLPSVLLTLVLWPLMFFLYNYYARTHYWKEIPFLSLIGVQPID